MKPLTAFMAGDNRHPGLERLVEKWMRVRGNIAYITVQPAHTLTWMSAGCRALLGLPVHCLTGVLQPAFYQQWHPEYLKLYRQTILPAQARLVSSTMAQSGQPLLFSFNFRAHHTMGIPLHCLQHSLYLANESDADACIHWLTNIYPFKHDQFVHHVAERLLANGGVAYPPILLETYTPGEKSARLSEREMEIYQAIFEGLKTTEIANKLSVSVHTINNHRKHILEKMHCRNAGELIKNALANPVH